MTRRPFLVWFISGSFILAFIVGNIATVLELTGVIPIDAATQQYNAALGYIGWFASLVSSAIALTAAIQLLMMRRTAVWFFIAALAIDTLEWDRQVFTQGYENIVAGIPISVVLVGWTIRIAIIFYCYRLNQKGLLK